MPYEEAMRRARKSKNGTFLPTPTIPSFMADREARLDRLAPRDLSRELTDNRMAETEEMGFLMTTLDYLARGQYATVGAYKAIEQGGDILGEAWKGLKGETKGSWIDVVEDLVPGHHPWAEIPIGFVGDVVLDPINLVPMAWFGKVGRLLRLPQLLKTADDLTKTTKVMKAVGNRVADVPFVSRQIGKFKPGWELRKVPGAYKKYRDLQLKLNNIRRLVKREMIQRWDEFRKVAKGMGQDPQKAAAELVRLREAGLASEVLPEFKPFYDDVVEGLAKLGKEEVEAGILNPKKMIDDYFPHIFETGEVVEKEGRLVAKKQTGFFTKLKFRSQPFYAKKREFKSIEEAKKAIVEWRKAGAVEEIAPVENWFRGYAIRRFVGESALAWRGFVDDSLGEFGVKLSELHKAGLGAKLDVGKLDDIMGLVEKGDVAAMEKLMGVSIPKGFSLVTATTNLRSPRMKGMFFKEVKKALQEVEGSGVATVAEELGMQDTLFDIFKKMGGRGVIDLRADQAAALVKGGAGDLVYLLPSEYAKQIKQTFKVFGTDESTRGFIRTVDSAVHMWKSMATSMRWPFHMRNAISNTWQMYLADVNTAKIPKRLAEALAVQLKQGKVAGIPAEEVLKIADRYGVRAYGWMGADVPTMLQKELHIIEQRSALARKVGVGDQPLNPFQAVSRLGRKFGTGVEDTARLGVFIDQIKKLGIKGADDVEKIEKAAAHVKKYLFDYTELTDFERKVMKRVFPFYTWLRKNIPVQLESLATKPWKYARLGDLSNAVDHGMQLWPDAAAPPTEQQLMKYHWMKEDNFRRTPWQTSGGWPIYYKIDLPTDDLNKMWRLDTWVSSLTPAWTLAQIGMNVRTWPKPGVISEPGQLSQAPFWMAKAPQWLHKMAGVRPMMDTRTGKAVLGMDPQWKYALKDAFPFLNDWERAYPQAGSLMAESDQGVYSALSYATGIKFRPFDKVEAAMSQGFRVRKAGELVRRAARKRPDLTVEDIKQIFKETLRP